MTAAGQDNTDRRFEVASVRRNVSGDTNMRVRMPPGRFEATNILIRDLIRMAHGLQSYQLVDGPEWLTTERYDIIGTADRAYAPDAEGAPPEVIAMIRTLLAERFGVRLRTESRVLPVFELRVARNDGRLGQGMRRVDVDCEAEARRAVPQPGAGGTTPTSACTVRVASTQLMGRGMTPAQIATAMSRIPGLDRPVVDRTGLTGTYDVDVQWNPDPASQDVPGVFTAIQEQLGLRLQPERGAVDVFVIAGVARPAEN